LVGLNSSRKNLFAVRYRVRIIQKDLDFSSVVRMQRQKSGGTSKSTACQEKRDA